MLIIYIDNGRQQPPPFTRRLCKLQKWVHSTRSRM